MIAVDTSLVVAAFTSWHEAHEVGTRALARAPRLPSHVAIETLSVLTHDKESGRDPSARLAACSGMLDGTLLPEAPPPPFRGRPPCAPK